MNNSQKVGFGCAVEGRVPGGSAEWRLENYGGTIRIDSKEIPEFWLAIHTDEILKKRKRSDSVLIQWRTTDAKGQKINMVRYVEEDELETVHTIKLENATTHAKVSEFPSLIEAWDSLGTTNTRGSKALYLTD
jgi:hypothetical protein